LNSIPFLIGSRRTRVPGATKRKRLPGATKRTRRPPVTKRIVQVKGCDDENNIRVKDDETLTGRIAIKKCGCERRYKNNATRLGMVSDTIAARLRVHFQKLYKTEIDYPVTVKVLTGNRTHTLFAYTVKVPEDQQAKVKKALKRTCKDAAVSEAYFDHI
jgi:hypothetical protein